MSAIVENTVVTYRLSNGTHILIHNTEPKDSNSTISCSNLQAIGSHSSDMYLDASAILTEDVEVIDNHVDWKPKVEDVKEISAITEEVLNLPDGYNLSMSNCDEMTLDPFGEIVMSFKCRSCSFLSEDRSELLEHFESSHSVDIMQQEELPAATEEPEVLEAATEPAGEARIIYLCGECNELLSSIAECRRHMLDAHNLSISIGSTTPRGDEDVNAPAEENDEESRSTQVDVSSPAESKFTCKVRGCTVKLASESALSIHDRCHAPCDADSRSRFRCYLCHLDCSSWRECVTHLYRAHAIDTGLLVCSECSYKTLTRVKLRNHMKTHGDARPYACTQPGCDRRFKQATQLRNHKVLHMDRSATKVPRWYSSKKCDICLKTYADSKCLKKHVQAVHSKLRPYVCGVCGHASARKAMLQMHARQHTGDKPHACAICPFRTGDHNSLRRHRMRHSGLKPYQCPHCPYAAIQSNSYKNHLRSRHPGLPGAYSCDDCDFRTVNQEALDSHAKHHLPGNSTEFFPENALAADMIYRCLGGADKWRADVTGSATSADGMTQTITIRLPTQGEDEESRCFLTQHLDAEEEEEVDTGGITIPADPMCL